MNEYVYVLSRFQRLHGVYTSIPTAARQLADLDPDTVAAWQPGAESSAFNGYCLERLPLDRLFAYYFERQAADGMPRHNNVLDLFVEAKRELARITVYGQLDAARMNGTLSSGQSPDDFGLVCTAPMEGDRTKQRLEAMFGDRVKKAATDAVAQGGSFARSVGRA